MRLFLALGLSLFLFSCSSGSDSKAPKEHAKRGASSTAAKPSSTNASTNAEGEKLFKMKCSACHKVDKN